MTNTIKRYNILFLPEGGGRERGATLAEIAEADIVVSGDVITKDRYNTAREVLPQLPEAKSLGQLIADAGEAVRNQHRGD